MYGDPRPGMLRQSLHSLRGQAERAPVSGSHVQEVPGRPATGRVVHLDVPTRGLDAVA